MKNILVVGSINVDMVIYADRMPKLGETMTGHNFSINEGGKGANQAVAAAKLGGNVQILGCVGTDIYGNMMAEQFRRSGVGTDGLTVCEGSTGVASITVCGGDNFIILDEGANAKLGCGVIDAHLDLLQWADIVILQFEIPMETVLYTAERAKGFGKMTIVNPAPMKAFPKELLEYTDLFAPNETETQLLLGREVGDGGWEDAVRAVQAMGCREVLITLGSKGCIYSAAGEIHTHGIVESCVVDTTAAGDSFIGGVAVALAEGKPMHEAVRFATYASSITVSRPGAGKSIPSRQEVLEFMKNN